MPKKKRSSLSQAYSATLSQAYSDTLSGFDTNTEAQELLAEKERGEIAKEMTNGIRSFARNMLINDQKFQDKMRVYMRKTRGDSTFFDNRLLFDADDGIWMFMGKARQCTFCGHILVSTGHNGKMQSCGTCKSTYYCSRACQKQHWKNGHKSVCRPVQDGQGMEIVLRMCIQALCFMRFTTTANIGSETVSLVCEEVLRYVLSPKEEPDSQKFVDLAKQKYPADNNRVCNHFRKKNECRRILCAVWETATDNLAFVPISIDFMSKGLGIAEATVESFKIMMAANDTTYFVLVMGKVKGDLGVAGGSSFIVVP